MPLSSSASITGTPRVITLPTTTTSGRGVSWRGLEPRGELDAERLELRAHGWIDVPVRPGDAVARRLGDGGDAAHERAADAENVNVHANLEPLGRAGRNCRTAARKRRSAAKFWPNTKMTARDIRPLERGVHDPHHTTSSQTVIAEEQQANAAGGGRPGPAFRCTAAATPIIGEQHRLEQRVHAEKRGHGLHEALGLLHQLEGRPGTTASGTTMLTMSSSGENADAVGDERDDDRRDTTAFTATTTASSAGDAGKCLRPAPQQYDVDETSEQYAEIRKHNAGPIVHVTRRTAPLMIDTADALTAFAASAARATRSRSTPNSCARKPIARSCACCRSPTAATPSASTRSRIADLSALAPLLGAPGVVKIMHAARQDLEVLLPAVGMVQPVFDTQIAAALAGHPSQVGYAELARRLLGVELPRRTRAPTGRAARCPPRSRNTRSTTCGTSAAARKLVRDADGEGPRRLARGRARGARERRRIARRARRGVEKGQRPAGARSRASAARAVARRLARTARRRTQSAARLDPRRRVPARDRAAAAAYRRSAGGAARDAGVRGAQMRRGAAGAGARRRHRRSAAAAAAPRASRSRAARAGEAARRHRGGSRARVSRSTPKCSPRVASSRNSPRANATSACCAAGARKSSARSC